MEHVERAAILNRVPSVLDGYVDIVPPEASDQLVADVALDNGDDVDVAGCSEHAPRSRSRRADDDVWRPAVVERGDDDPERSSQVDHGSTSSTPGQAPRARSSP